MTGSSLAEALYRAHKEKATGALRMTSGGRESRLLLREGDLVGAQVGFGYRTAVQAMLLSGRLDYGSLDGLWARGDAGHPDPETLELCELDVAGLRDLQLLANIRSLARAGEDVELVPADVAHETARIAGALAVRAAFEAVEGRQGHYRCPDLAACEPWIVSDSDRAFLQAFSSASQVPEDATASQRALLRLLAFEGTIEALTDEEFERREVSRTQEQEHALREVEEARQREEEAARVALQAEEARQREEEAARVALQAEEARQREEEAARVALQAEEARQREEEAAARAALEAEAARAAAAQPIEAAEPRAADADWLASDEAAEQARMREARAHAQLDAQKDLQEALRRSTGPADDVWLDGSAAQEVSEVEILPADAAQAELPEASGTETIELSPADAAPAELPQASGGETIELSVADVSPVSPEPSAPSAAPEAAAAGDWGASLDDAPPPQIVADLDERAPAPDSHDAYWAVSSPPAAAAPAAPAAPSAAEDPDLWQIVTFDKVPQDSLSSSFDEAMRKVDAHLENLVGMGLGDAVPDSAPNPFPDASALPEVSVEAVPVAPPPPVLRPSPAGDIPAAREDTEPSLEELEELFPFDEAELAGDPADPAEAAKLRRQRLLKRAMENMGVLRRPGAVATPEGAPAPAGPAAPATADEAQLARSIEARHQQLQSKPTHFAVLGLSKDAPRDQVKAAFLSLAKTFHPDRLPPGLAALSPKMNSVFEAIREAYEVLYDDAKRKAYVAALQAAPAPAAPAAATSSKRVQEATELFKRGEVYFKKRDFKTAEEHFQKAYDADNKATYLAAKAWAIYMDPTRKGETATARQLMTEALRIDPSCDRAHYQLGVIARVDGDTDAAERHFRDAVRANPKHLEANQELRLIEIRKKSSPGKKGLFR